jgi:hypothetical protein
MSVRLCGDRIATIIVGYGVAAITAGTAICIVMVAWNVATKGLMDSAVLGFGVIAAVLIGIFFVIPFTAILALMPSALLIAVAEWRSIRSPASYGLMGALAGIATWAATGAFAFLMSKSPPSAGLASYSNLWLLTVIGGIPGLCGGLAYWAVAGRNAGRCGERPSSAAASGSTTQALLPLPQSLQS